MYAIIATGGKQYKVAKDDVLEIEKLDGKTGDKIELDVIMTSESGSVEVGSTKKASATIVAQVKDKKIVVYKYKPKKNIRKKQGHRQPHTKIRIDKI